MKKYGIIIILVGVCLICITKFKNNRNTNYNENVKLAVMAGPTAFSSCALDDFITVEVYSAPDKAVANLLNGTVDMAVLPANKAFALQNDNNAVKILAVVGEGMLSIVGTSQNEERLSVPSAGDTPDIMATLLYPEYERDYSVSSPAQIAQLLIAGKIKTAILPQPFVNMVLEKNKDLKIISNVQERWYQKTGLSQYPMSVLVASEKFSVNNDALLQKVADSYKKSVKWVLANPEKAGKKIEDLGIMSQDIAASAVPFCALCYKSANEAKDELQSYLDFKNLIIM